MAFAQILLIWSLYAFVVVILLAVASVFVHIYQTPPDRYPSVTFTCVIAITSLLATVLLLPVDVALVSSTTSPNLGRRKDWATQDEIDKITYSLTVVYYLLFSLDALLCLLGIPFAYFWCEEYDECATETSQQMVGWRLWGALKYTMSFVAILTILFLAGLFVPVSRNKEGTDPDYFKKLLTANCEFLRPSLVILGPRSDMNPYRWRTCSYFCHCRADGHRNMPLCSIYFLGSCALPNQLDQGCPINLQYALTSQCGSTAREKS
jgi:hypothetical protein